MQWLKSLFLIPETKKIGNIKDEIIKAINELYPGVLDVNQQFNLFEKTTGQLIINDKYVRDYIKNGSYLVLM